MNIKKNLVLLIIILTIPMVLTSCNEKSKVVNNANEKKVSEKSTNSSDKIIRVAVERDGQPYVFEENGEVKGIEGDMWKEIEKRTGYKIEYEFNNFDGLFGLLDNKKVDTIAHFLGKNEQRAQKYDFSDPYAYATLQFIVKSDAPEIKSIKDLYGKKLGIGIGSASFGVIKKLDPDEKIVLKPYESSNNMLQDVNMGRLDAFIDNILAMPKTIKKMNVDCKIDPFIVKATEVGYPFRKDDPKSAELRNMINKTIKEMKDDGTVSKICKKWLDIDVSKIDGLSNKK